MISFLLKKIKKQRENKGKVVKALIIKEMHDEFMPYVLLGFEKDTNKWKFIGGNVEENETLKDALFREVLEETGIPLTDGNIDGEPYKYNVNGKEIYVYFVKHNGDTPNEIGDIDQEFKKLNWFPVGMVVKGKIDLAPPVNENVCVKALIERYKDFLNTREGIQIDEMQTDETNKKLSFKEKRELTKQFFELRDKIKATKNFKEKRELTKKFFELRDKILGKKTKSNEKRKKECKYNLKIDFYSDYPSINGSYPIWENVTLEELKKAIETNKLPDVKIKNGVLLPTRKMFVETIKNGAHYSFSISPTIESMKNKLRCGGIPSFKSVEEFNDAVKKLKNKDNEDPFERLMEEMDIRSVDHLIEKAKEILTKDDLTLDDLEFFTPQVLKYLDEKEKEGDPRVLELDEIVRKKLQELKKELQKDGLLSFDEIETLLDSIEGEKLSTLLEKMFVLRKVKSKKNENDKLKAFKELQKLVETDPNIRDLLEMLVEELKAYSDEL